MHPRSTPTRLPRWDPGAGCVAPPSNIPDILGRRALPARRLARLGATPDFHHGLLGDQRARALWKQLFNRDGPKEDSLLDAVLHHGLERPPVGLDAVGEGIVRDVHHPPVDLIG